MKKKIFISMAMNCRDNTELKQEQLALFNKFCEQERIERVNSIENGNFLDMNAEVDEYELLETVFDFPGKSGLFYMGHGIIQMYDADIIIFGKGFDKARGCIIEHACAVAYKIPTILYETDNSITPIHPSSMEATTLQIPS